MIITHIGHSCFKIQDKIGEENVVLVTDPYGTVTGLKMPNLEADILTISHEHEDHNNRKAVKGNPFIIDTAGEYDVAGVAIVGVEAFHDEKKGAERGKTIIYRFEFNGISVAHLGDLACSLNSEQLEVLSGTDILLIPVGGKYTLDAKKAMDVVAQIEPRIIIPMHYKVPALKYDIDGVDKFIKESGLSPSNEAKLKITKKDLPVEDMELVILDN